MLVFRRRDAPRQVPEKVTVGDAKIERRAQHDHPHVANLRIPRAGSIVVELVECVVVSPGIDPGLVRAPRLFQNVTELEIDVVAPPAAVQRPPTVVRDREIIELDIFRKPSPVRIRLVFQRQSDDRRRKLRVAVGHDGVHLPVRGELTRNLPAERGRCRIDVRTEPAGPEPPDVLCGVVVRRFTQHQLLVGGGKRRERSCGSRMPDPRAVDKPFGPGLGDVAVCQSGGTVRRQQLRGLILSVIHAARPFGSHPVFVPVARIGVQNVPLAPEQDRRIVDRIQVRRRGGDPLALGPAEVVDQILVIRISDHPLVAEDVDQLPLVQHSEGIFFGCRRFPHGSGLGRIVRDPPLRHHLSCGTQGEHQEQKDGLHRFCRFIC